MLMPSIAPVPKSLPLFYIFFVVHLYFVMLLVLQQIEKPEQTNFLATSLLISFMKCLKNRKEKKKTKKMLC